MKVDKLDQICDFKSQLGGLELGKMYLDQKGEPWYLIFSNRKYFSDHAFRAFRDKNNTKHSWTMNQCEESITADGRIHINGRYDLKDITLDYKYNPRFVPACGLGAIQLGADPELALVGKEGRNSAEKLIVGKGQDETRGSFGFDGNAAILEIRPNTSPDPRVVVGNIQHIISEMYRLNPILFKKNNRVLSGSYKDGWSIGGHIHFSVPRRSGFVPMLDAFLGILSLNLEHIDELVERRREKNYGLLGDARMQNHGFEYRSLASWLETPLVALAHLSLAKHIINQFYIPQNSKVFKSDLVLSEIAMTRNYIGLWELEPQKIKKFAKLTFDSNWPEIMSWPMEASLREGLIAFEQLVTSGFTYDNRDLKETWGIKCR